MAAQRLYHLVVAGVIGETGANDAVLAVHALLSDQDLAPLAVVPHHGDHGQVEAHQRIEVEAVEAEGAVSVHHQHLLLGMHILGGDAKAGAHAQGAQRAGAHELAGEVDWQYLRRKPDDVAAVADDDGVLIDERGHVVAEAQGMDGYRVGVDPALAKLGYLRLAVAQPLEPLVVLRFAVAQLAAQLLEQRARVALKADVELPVAAELRRVDVDGDDLCLFVDTAPEGEAEVHGHADEDGDVGGLKRLPAAAVEEERVLLADTAAAHVVQVERRIQPFG